MRFQRAIDRLHDVAREAVAPLDAVADAVPSGSVLELGCGQGLLMAKLVGRCQRVVGVDFDPRKCRMARESLGRHGEVEIVEGDILTYLRQTAERFDNIILSDTLSSMPFGVQDDVLRIAGERLTEGGQIVLKLIDTAPATKAALAYAMFVVVYRILKASKSHERRVFYRPHETYCRLLEQLGLTSRVTLLHERPRHPLPHVLIVAEKRGRKAGVAPPGPRVRFVVPNLRLGGQLTSLIALRDRLRDDGIDADLLLPSRLSGCDRTALTLYARAPVLARALDAVALLRGARRLASDRTAVLHVMLPTPAFSPLLRLTGFPPERTVAQYEGRTLRLDAGTLALLRDDPAFIFPRLALNRFGAMLGWLAPPVHHVATVPSLTGDLVGLRGERHELVNLASLDVSDAPLDEALVRQLCEPAIVTLAYVGHAHPVKGVDDLIRAFAVARRTRPDLRLVVALSEDGDAARVVRLARSLGLDSPAITFRGLVPVRSLLAAVDWLVLPYRSAMTTTLLPSLFLEANVAGCPTVVARLPELLHVIRHDSAVVASFPSGNVPALSRVLSTRTKRTASYPGGVARLPDSRVVIDTWSVLYRSLVGVVTS